MSGDLRDKRGAAKPGGGKRKNRDTRKQARRDAAAARLARSEKRECGHLHTPEAECDLGELEANDPVVCTCETPSPAKYGECSTCRRPVLALLWNEGIPQ